MKRSGFTLIELIVVMAILAILILLGVPKYKEYTKQAELTKLMVECKELETASQKYYISKGDWPRLTNEPYTAEEITLFGDKIYDKTGAVVTLDENGNYYDINYNSLSKYITKIDSPENYILQNPVGNVYSIKGITKIAKERLGNIELPEEEDKVEYSPSGWFIINSSGAVSASEELKALPYPVDVVIPEEIDGIKVTSIANRGFYNLANIKSMILSNSILHIGESAFYNCKGLISLKLNEGLETIDIDAFSQVTNLSHIDIPESMTKIGPYVFRYWTPNQSVTIKSRDNKPLIVLELRGNPKITYEDLDDYFVISDSGSVSAASCLRYVEGPVNLIIPEEINGVKATSIPSNAFNGLTNIVSVIMPNSIMTMGDGYGINGICGAFEGCINLESVTFSESLQKIGAFAFADCPKLNNVFLSNSIRSIDKKAFYNCIGITNMRLNEGLSTIGEQAFERMTNLLNLDIPKSVTLIYSYAFRYWTSSQTVTIKARDNAPITIHETRGSQIIIYEDLL